MLPEQRVFYMPRMRGEIAAVLDEALPALVHLSLHRAPVSYKLRHKVLITWFGRYPHRNPCPFAQAGC